MIANLHTISQLLLHSCLELQKKTGLQESSIEEILSVAARYVVSKEVQYTTATDIFERKRNGNAFQVYIYFSFFFIMIMYLMVIYKRVLILILI